MADPTREVSAFLPRRAMYLLLSGVVAVAAVGYFVGLDDGVPHHDEIRLLPPAVTHDGPGAGGPVIPAPRYEDLPNLRIGPNRDWKSSFDRLVQPPADLTATIEVDPEAKLVSLQERSERRAYNGAPPVIPHAADQMTAANCMTCHRESLRIGARSAHRPPHPYLTSCTQCHVEQESGLFAAAILAENSFRGLPAPTEGPRAWTGAPPVVPHSTFMRDDCLSCHGPQGRPGMRTTHPERRSCLQCHAPSAVLDQAIVGGAEPSFLSELQIASP